LTINYEIIRLLGENAKKDREERKKKRVEKGGEREGGEREKEGEREGEGERERGGERERRDERERGERKRLRKIISVLCKFLSLNLAIIVLSLYIK